MKRKLLFLLISALGIGLLSESSAQTTTTTFNANGNFPVPAGVTNVSIQCWGAGGGGARKPSVSSDGGGGGGGGGFRGGTLIVSPGDNIAITVGTGGATGLVNGAGGANGGFSRASHASGVITADGGTGGGSNISGVGTGGAGGAGTITGTVTNPVTFTGGTGGTGDNDEGGAGGGGAGSTGDGGNGDNGNNGTHNGGTAGGGGGGVGGGGGDDGAGGNGATLGGGGGAAGDSGGAGGAGANGQVTVTYTLPNLTGLSVAVIKACTGDGASFTISSSNLVSDTYTITYTIIGTLNGLGSTNTNVTFVAGTPGTVTLTTPTLTGAENDVFRITRVTNSLGNFVDLTNNTNFTMRDCSAWYTYQTGVFNDFNTWTLDPSGTTFDNGLNITPSTGDQITILNGFTVTCNVNNLNLETTTIQGGGILDMVSTTGHNLGVVTGTGQLRIRGIALPSGTYTDFVSTLGGTVEYYDIGGTLSTTQTTYNKLIMSNSTGSGITYLQISDLIVNSTFDLTTTGVGTVGWQINDLSNTQRTITLNGDLTVSAGGRITVGGSNVNNTSGNEAGNPHNLTMYGNFTNSGIVSFLFDDTELPAANYANTTTGTNNIYTNELQGNAVAVTFLGTSNKTVTCNNTTDFYRFILNKGTGQQAMLTVNSANTAYFRLFGPTNLGSSGNGTSPNEYSGNSLSIINGTLQLTGSIDIPNLELTGVAANDYFSLPQNGSLWLNGANVSVTVANYDAAAGNQLGRRFMLNGLLRVTAGSFDAGISAGVGSQDGGSYFQEGGTVKCWQFRPRQNGNGVFSFRMTGGTLNVGYTYAVSQGYDNTAYARFDLNSTNSSFVMSGGNINVAKPTNGSGIFQVLSANGNYSVTGGTVNVYTGLVTANEYEAYINSTVPLYNLNIYRESGTTTTAQLQNQDLTVLNDLTINTGNTPSFLTFDRALTIGGNFNIQASTTFTPTNSIITFNGTGSQLWTHNGTISTLVNVVMNKASGTLTLAGSQVFPNITGSLTLTSGTLADGGKTITVSGTGTLSNSATHSGAGVIDYTSTAATISGTGGTFGNLTITTNATIATNGNQTVTGTLRLVGANTTLNILSNSLTVGSSPASPGNIYSNASPGTAVVFSATKRILTSGLHNAGGLTRQGVAGDLLFPVGASAVGANGAVGFSPATINVGATTQGMITLRPVNSEHPNVYPTTGQSLRYYWRVTSSGYVNITTVTHKTYTFNSTALLFGTLTTYRQARYNRTTNSWGYSGTYNATGTTVIPNFNTGASWTNVTGDQLDGEYTCGNINALGAVITYYSRQTGDWNVNATWSTISVGNATPATSNPTSCATCPVIIGDGTLNHVITTVANSSCGTLTLSSGSTLDCSTFTGHNFGTNSGGAVSGRGILRINSNAFPAGDFTNFLGSSGGTVEWYGATKTIPSIGLTPQSLNLVTYYNLIVNPSSGNTITMPANDLAIYNSFTQGTGVFTGTTVTNGSRAISVAVDLTISQGIFNFSTANPSVTTLTVGGTTTVSNGATMACLGGGTANLNTLTTPGGIVNNGTINFRNTQQVNVTFTGTNNVSFSGNGTTTLSLITVNKGSSQTPTVTFSNSGTVTTTAVALGWLTLTNGTFDWGNTTASNISTNSYTIPSTGKLKVSAGTINTTSGDADGNDLFLSGALEVSGGTVNVGNATVNGNNVDIEYAAAGNPAITVSSGTLWVKTAIRRSITTITGALVYNQTGGAVTLGGISATENSDRGVFEIDSNTGSSFTLNGTSSLTLQQQTGGTGYADLFINPVTSNVASTSTISVGLSSSTTNTNFRINVSPSIGNFTIAGTNAHIVNMFSNSLRVGGTLTIPTPSILNTNSLDVFIAGDLVCTGTYTGGTNNTTFNGTGAQAGALSATSTFNDVTISKTAGTTLTLSGTSPTLQNLYILTGILNVGSLALDIRKNVTNNSSQTGAGSILIFSTTANSNTITSSNGSFTNLTLGGTATSKTITVNGNSTISGTLTFPASGTRYFYIGSSQLTFGNSAPAIANASSTRFIKTNGVSSDLGVVKNWNATGTFVYQVGSSTYYTPVSLSLNVTVAGTMSVVPVNSLHPTYNQASPERILKYYWIVSRGGTLAATASGSHTYTYPSSLITGTGGTLVAGYLDGNSNPLGWTTSAHGGTATTTLMTYTSTPTTNLPTIGNFYDYSVGTVNTLPNPIVPLYSRIGLVATVGNTGVGGVWTTASNWTTDSDGDLNLDNASALVPNGVPVVILSGGRINTSSAGRKAYRTTINGLLNNGTITGHNLGILGGTGTFRTATNTFPAGNYTAFVAAGGGTIEYVAPMTMNSRTTYNNLSIYSGSAGTVNLTASDLTINGNVTIPTGTTLSKPNDGLNVNISISGDMLLTGGTFIAGSGAVNANVFIAGNWSNSGTYTPNTSTVTFNGTGAQTANGSFYALTMDKSAGNLSLAATTTINNTLTLTSGNILTTSSNLLVLNSSLVVSGGSGSSFVSGPLTKIINASSSFTAPVGSVSVSRYRPATIANTSGTDTWSFEYVGSDPSTGGFSSTTMNTANIGTVSQWEYWLISRSGATTADLTLTYNTGSYRPPDVGVMANLRVARWNGAQWDLPPTSSGVYSQSGTNTAGSVTVTNVTNFSPETLASTDVDSPLPIELLYFSGRLTQAGVELNWETASETENDYFSIEKSIGGEKFGAIGKVKGAGTSTVSHRYQFVDTDTHEGVAYYRLKQTDFNGSFTYSKVISIRYNNMDGILVSVYPNPSSGNEITLEVSGLDNAENVMVTLSDQIGRQYFKDNLDINSNGSAINRISTENLSSGVYILKVGTYIKRVVISR